MPSAKIVSTYQDLNSLGCEMLLATNESHVTRMTSSKMRWISLKNDKNEFISKNQKKYVTLFQK